MRYACTLALLTTPTLLGVAQTPAMPSITTPKEAGQTSLVKLHELRISVKVVGNLAITTWDMVLRNETNRIVEGSLEFPLGDGQTVSRFAMDVNGVLREGVVVEKAKGRQAFESIVRRGVDPGLLEKTEGNNFRARVYPIPASGTKRVVIAYEQEIQSPSPGEGLFYQLPLRFQEAVKHFELKVDALQQKHQPALKSATTGFAFQASGSNWYGETRLTDYVPNQTLEFTLPAPPNTESVFVQRDGDRRYFCVNVNVEAPKVPKVMPRNLLVAWDASASAEKRDRNKELDLLEVYLKRIGNCLVELVVFRNSVQPPCFFTIQNGEAKELRAYLETLALDGGTQLGSLDLKDHKADEILLFSDGMSNFGQRIPTLIKDCPLVAVSTAASGNSAVLRNLAEGSGGQFIDLGHLKLEQAFDALNQQGLHFLGWSGAPGDIHEVYPSRRARVQGPFVLAGLQVRDHSEITLNFGYGSRITATRKLLIRTGEADVSGTNPIARIWAQKKLAELQLDAEAHAKEILALGMEHSIVTEGTSLIVLETLQDHITYRIPPPPEWRAQYEQTVQGLDRFQKHHQQAQRERVWNQFQPLREWWKGSGPKPPAPPAQPSTAVPPPPPPSADAASMGELCGTVTDDQGNPIQGARITVDGSEIILPRTCVTDTRGWYQAQPLPSGIYTIRVSAPGMLSMRSSRIHVGSGSRLNKPFVLHRQENAESATVEVVSKIAQEAIANDQLALNLSAEQLMQLPPGVGFSGALSLAPSIENPGEGAAVRGSNINKVMYRIDGINVKDDAGGGSLYQPLQDSIEDISVVVSELNARNGGPEIRAQRQARRRAAGQLPENPAPASVVTVASSNTVTTGHVQETPLPPYLKAIRKASPAERYEAYLNLRQAYGKKAAFYLDMADCFEEWNEHALALRVLSNLAELRLEDAPLMRVLGHRLAQMKEWKLALSVFEKVLKMREEEPQSLRDLALVLEADGQYQKAFDTLCQVLEKNWDGRFPEIENTVLEEINALAARHTLDTSRLDPRLLLEMPVDIRVVINWDTDNSDMDLWVTDPSGETCNYSHNRTAMGGRISRDFTQGYGPEVFTLKRAKPGTYTIQANYFGTRQQTADIGPTTLHAEVFTNYGTPDQQRQDIMLRLDARGSLLNIGKIEIPDRQKAH